MLGTIIGGVGVLFGLAVAVHHTLDRHARTAAWQRIATSRRINQLATRDLEERELALQVREDALDHRERRLDQRSQRLVEREDLLERRELTLHDRTSSLSDPGTDGRDDRRPMAQRP